jgi:hypothetical protein
MIKQGCLLTVLLVCQTNSCISTVLQTIQAAVDCGALAPEQAQNISIHDTLLIDMPNTTRVAKFEGDCAVPIGLMKEVNLGLMLASGQLGQDAGRNKVVVGFAGVEPRRIATSSDTALVPLLMKCPDIISVFGADGDQKGADVLTKPLNICHPMAALMGCDMATYGLWLKFVCELCNPVHFSLYTNQESQMVKEIDTFLKSNENAQVFQVRKFM